MKKVTLTFSPEARAWIHDPSGLRFFGWSEGPTKKEEFEKVVEIVKARLAGFYTGLAGHPEVTPDDVAITWGATVKAQTPPLSVVTQNLQADFPRIDPAADPTAGTAPLLRHAKAQPRT